MAKDEVPQADREGRVNDMARRGFQSPDYQARYNVGALEQRVYTLEQGIAGIANQINALSQQITTGARTNWPVLTGFATVLLAVVGLVGGLAYWPIREAQADAKVGLSEANKAIVETTKTIAAMANQNAFQFNSLGDKFVSIRELEGRSGRAQADMVRLNSDIASQEISLRRSIEQGDANLQRQIDDQKKQFGDTFSLRDALLQMQRRIDQLEAARRSS